MTAAIGGTGAGEAAVPVQGTVQTGAAVLATNGFKLLPGQRVGLITNQTGRVGVTHLADLLHAAPGVRLAAIFGPEHGFRGIGVAGASVAGGRDPKTGVVVHSLYGATKSPTADMLRGVDVLVFDIQDIGARFYTYISTMGLAMQAAARARLPFMVLDRPNPLGGADVSGFVLERPLASFVGRYPIPIVHGMSVGELAQMIRGERWLTGVEDLDLTVIPCIGVSRGMRWPATGLGWIATSPNIPTFEAALVYPGIGMVGETLVNEGRGTPTPFSQFGTPWLDAPRLAADLAAARLAGARFEATRYVPRAISGVALDPRYLGEDVAAVRITVTDSATYRPLDVGIHALAGLQRQARQRGTSVLPPKRGMFNAIAGTTRLARMLDAGASGADIIASWHDEIAQFRAQRKPYLLY